MKKQVILFMSMILALLVMMPVVLAQEQSVGIKGYQWAFSSDQTNYYFGRDNISYAVDKHGKIDKSRLLFSAIMTYEQAKAQDIIAQREANGQKMTGYENFHGIIEVREIDLDKKMVLIQSHQDIDAAFKVLNAESSDQLYDLKVLPKDHPEYIFAQQIIDYAANHEDDLNHNTKNIQRALRKSPKTAGK